jgi:hypothetical protein
MTEAGQSSLLPPKSRFYQQFDHPQPLHSSPKTIQRINYWHIQNSRGWG